MKKTVKILALALVLVMMVAVFASCGKPSGKYVNGAFFYEFDGDDFTANIELPIVGTVTISGTYEIKDDKIILTYELGSISKTSEYSYAKDGDVITIGGVEYTKEK